MRKITAIPSKKIAFKNVPVSGLFFLKRTLYKKISIREASYYGEQNTVYIESQKIVRFVAKQHENIAVDLYESKHISQEEVCFAINDVVEIISKNVLGKVVSVNRNSCLIQYKQDSIVSFDEFSIKDLRKISSHRFKGD